MRTIGRRAALRGLAGGVVAGGAVLTAAAPALGQDPAAPAAGGPPGSAGEGLHRLLEGNRRWQEIRPTHPHESAAVRTTLVAAQHPFAMILSCVDSRVPTELVFDQGLGDLFTARTAGQVLDDAVLGSLAFGLLELHVPLVVVLGHSSCGAVGAAVDALDAGEEPPGHLATLTRAIEPSVPGSGDRAARIAAAVDANTRRVAEQLRTDEDLADAVRRGTLTVVAARYDLGSGAVTVL